MLDFDIKTWLISFGVLICLKCVSGDTQNVSNLSQNLFLSEIILQILKKCRHFLNSFWYDGKVPRFSRPKTCFLDVSRDCKKQLFSFPNFNVWKFFFFFHGDIFFFRDVKVDRFFAYIIFNFWPINIIFCTYGIISFYVFWNKKIRSQTKSKHTKIFVFQK